MCSPHVRRDSGSPGRELDAVYTDWHHGEGGHRGRWSRYAAPYQVHMNSIEQHLNSSGALEEGWNTKPKDRKVRIPLGDEGKADWA